MATEVTSAAVWRNFFSGKWVYIDYTRRKRESSVY